MNKVGDNFEHTREEILKEEKLDSSLAEKKVDVSLNTQNNCSKVLLKKELSAEKRKARRTWYRRLFLILLMIFIPFSIFFTRMIHTCTLDGISEYDFAENQFLSLLNQICRLK